MDYKKFKGFVPFGLDMVALEARVHGDGNMGCNRCPYPNLPPCRDPNHPDYNPHGKWAAAHQRFKVKCNKEACVCDKEPPKPMPYIYTNYVFDFNAKHKHGHH